MSGDFDALETRSGLRRPLVLHLLVAGFFFLLGIGAMGWLLSRWDEGARMLGVEPTAEPAATAAPPPQQRQPAAQPPSGEPAGPATEEEPQRILIDPEVGRRVAALERRVGELDAQSRAAVGNADRAEGLLVAFAARRALDRGVALGFLEALLRQRFGESQPQAVGMIISAAREPVTLQELQDGLQEIGPQLVGAGPEQNWWDAFRTELGNLITVRREGTPSPEPSERLTRATRWLQAGEVGPALAEVLRMPGRAYARDWVARARRYVGARRALDTIETAALLEPRTPAPAQTPPEGAETEPASAAGNRPATSR